MHGKEEFTKIKGSNCNIPIEAANICIILPRLVDSNGLLVVKLKRDLKYRGYVYLEPVRPNVIYQTLNFLKIKYTQKVLWDVSIHISRSLKEKNDKFFKYSWTSRCCWKYSQKIISSETGYGSTEDPLSTHGTGSHEAVLVSEITSIINDENIIIALEQGKKPVSILNDEFFDEQAFPYSL